MKKRIFFNSPRLSEKCMAAMSSVAIISLLLMIGGCQTKVYIPSEKEAKSHIVLINNIYSAGFYVELDGRDAGFLEQELDIRVKPGGHELKLFNKETSLSLLKEMQETTTHKFSLKAEVGEGETKEIVLSWEDKGYSKKVEKGVRPTNETEKEEQKKKERSAPTHGGMPY